MSDVVIQVENVSKLYRLGEVGTGSLAHDFNRWWHKVCGREDPYALVGQTNDRTQAAGDSDYAWALQGVSFEVRKGEVLGIIGRNGAGKSTLLKILSRVTTQTTGSIKVKGRIASLLEVGTGFHPELTGRDNIFLNGAILGMRKAEIARKFDEIVEFSGCARYIDTPVKRYSSGMYVRLAFAVAAHLEPEILIVDEVLAVGDAEFQKKCLGKMKDVAGHGRTILFVSHNMAAVTKLCKTSILMDQGKIIMFDSTEKVLSHYINFGTESSGYKTWAKDVSQPFFMKKASIYDAEGKISGHLDIRKGFKIQVEYEILKKVPRFRIALRVVMPDGTIAFTASDSSHNSYDSKPITIGSYITQCFIPGNLLNEGQYSLTLCADVPFAKPLFYEEGALTLSIEQTGGVSGKFPEKWPGVVCPNLDWNTLKINNLQI